MLLSVVFPSEEVLTRVLSVVLGRLFPDVDPALRPFYLLGNAITNAREIALVTLAIYTFLVSLAVTVALLAFIVCIYLVFSVIPFFPLCLHGYSGEHRREMRAEHLSSPGKLSPRRKIAT